MLAQMVEVLPSRPDLHIMSTSLNTGYLWVCDPSPPAPPKPVDPETERFTGVLDAEPEHGRPLGMLGVLLAEEAERGRSMGASEAFITADLERGRPGRVPCVLACSRAVWLCAKGSVRGAPGSQQPRGAVDAWHSGPKVPSSSGRHSRCADDERRRLRAVGAYDFLDRMKAGWPAALCCSAWAWWSSWAEVCESGRLWCCCV